MSEETFHENDSIHVFNYIKKYLQLNYILALTVLDLRYWMSLCDQCDDNKQGH